MYIYKTIKKLSLGTGTLINLCEKDGKEVVLKESTEERYFKSLKSELDVISLLSPHKNLVEVKESFIFNKKIYIEYEYYEKGDLYDCIENGGPFDESAACCLLRQLVDILKHAYKNGFYHCDIKPENVLLRNENEYVLCDWDVVRTTDNLGSSLGFGSSLSMAPEVMLGQISETSDVYSLGCLIYFSLFGKRIFDLKPNEPKSGRVLKHLEGIITLPNNNLSENFKYILRAMLYKNPKQRLTLDEIDIYLQENKIPNRKDIEDIYSFMGDFIIEKYAQRSRTRALKKFNEEKALFEKDKSPVAQNNMIAHLIIRAYLNCKESQKKLATYYEEGKDLEKSTLWLKRSIY